jgi:hypothetical protein
LPAGRKVTHGYYFETGEVWQRKTGMPIRQCATVLLFKKFKQELPNPEERNG